MSETAPLEALQRAEGLVRLAVARQGSATRIASLRQQGNLKMLFPRLWDGGAMQAVAVNCSGGVAAGDRLHTEITCGAGTELVFTTQAAERCYRARPGEPASILTATVRLEAGASLHWLPQETILFDGAHLRRTLQAEMAPDAAFLCLESRVFGRRLHGETIRRLALSDRLVIKRAGSPVLVDGLEIDGDAASYLARAAIGGGAVACAAIVLVSPAASLLLDRVREVLAGAAAVSSWNSMLRVLIVSQEEQQHRARIAAVLSVLRAGAALPAVWRC